MSYYLNSRPLFGVSSLSGTGSTVPRGNDAFAAKPIGDDQLDTALRQVPLPEGFVGRLDQLVCELSDEPTDQVDYLGC